MEVKLSSQELIDHINVLKKENSLLKKNLNAQKNQSDFIGGEREKNSYNNFNSQIEKHLLSSFFNTFPIGINVFDASGRVLFVNQFARELFGVDKDDPLIGYCLFDDPSIKKETKEAIKRGELAQEERFIDFNAIYAHNMYNTSRDINTKVCIQLNYSPYGDDFKNPLGYILTILDISVKKDFEQVSLKLNKMNAAKDKFFSIIAHDLRSPFNTILGFTNLLLESTRNFEIEKFENYLGIINSSTKNTLVLLDNLLDWASFQTGKIEFNPEKLIVSSLIKNSIENSNSAAKIKNISLNYNCESEIEVFADSNMLKSILRNLISNAIKFTNVGGEINLFATIEKNHVEITVSDNGIGMNQETLSELFEISKKVSSVGTNNEKGSGLGLALCNDFVKKHQGEVYAKSTIGKGSDFIFTLPLN